MDQALYCLNTTTVSIIFDSDDELGDAADPGQPLREAREELTTATPRSVPGLPQRPRQLETVPIAPLKNKAILDLHPPRVHDILCSSLFRRFYTRVS